MQPWLFETGRYAVGLSLFETTLPARSGISRVNSNPYVPTSVVLTDLLGRAPAEGITLKWLIGSLGRRSFGVVLLLLGLLGLLPGIAAIAGILLLVPSFQMILANGGPIFTRRIESIPLSTRRVAGVIRRSIPVLRYLERFIRPRWPTPFEATKRVVGFFILLLGLCIVLLPVPFMHIPPALLIVLIAFAYLEEDGVLLCAALMLAIVLIAAATSLVWETVTLARWLPPLFQHH